MKTFVKLSFCASLLLGLVACSGDKKEESSAQNSQREAHWGYGADNGPSHWGELGFETCEKSVAQSPVDIITKEVVHVKNRLDLRYADGSKNFINNGHSVQVNYENGGSIVFNNKEYALMQVHFHTPSENQIDGVRYPLEAHFVHKAKDDSLLVVGVLFEEGQANKALDRIVQNAPKKVGASVDFSNFSPEDLIPQEHGYYSFMGSLTTPPCSENVQWVVLKAKENASKEQIAALHEILGDDARDPQALNKREVDEAN